MSLHGRLGKHAASRPTALAVTDEQGTLTYRELQRDVDVVRDALVDHGIGPGKRVGVVAPRSKESLVVFLAALECGASYVPLDPTGPVARSVDILGQSNVSTLVVPGDETSETRELIKTMPRPASVLTVARVGTTVEVDVLHEASVETRRSEVPADEAYVFFTSGSTGRPKGVSLSTRNAEAFMEWATQYFDIGPDAQIASTTPLTFDLSVFDLYAFLFGGGTLHFMPDRAKRIPRTHVAFLRESRTTHWLSVPGALTLLSSAGALRDEAVPDLRHLSWCGEVLSAPVVIDLMETLPGVTLTNLYGPTETATASTYYTVLDRPQPDDRVPIGVPCDGEVVLVLDEEGRELPAGETGEICIGGVGVANGYLEPVEGSSPFVTYEVNGRPERFYRTGDIGYRDESGLLHFVGRADSQLKVRGFRVEIGEVEAVIRALPIVHDAAVVAIDGGLEGMRLCCSLAPLDSDTTLADVQAALRSRLPEYMFPSDWTLVDELPALPNGKTDRKRLRDDFARAYADRKQRAAAAVRRVRTGP